MQPASQMTKRIATAHLNENLYRNLSSEIYSSGRGQDTSPEAKFQQTTQAGMPTLNPCFTNHPARYIQSR